MYRLKYEADFLNKNVGRFSAFTFVFWCQNSYDDPVTDINYWRNYLYSFLSSLRVPAAVSPCHDRDINEVDTYTGLCEYKKAHFHVVIDFGSGSNKSIKQIYDLINPIRSYISIAPFDESVPDCDSVLADFDISSLIYNSDDDEFTKVKKVWLSSNSVRNMRSLLRYFKHLDNPEKYQYTEDIYSIGGFEVEDRIYSQTDSYVILDHIFDYIETNHVYSFWKLLKYCRVNNREWYSIICKNMYASLVINAMKSFAVDDTGYLDRKIDKYSKGFDVD